MSPAEDPGFLRVRAHTPRSFPWMMRALRVLRFFRIRLSKKRSDRLVKWLAGRTRYEVMVCRGQPDPNKSGP